ncbi:hypothetical protein HPB48_019566 [Haemaphysalis longicornis]|uniref:Uncharacterized protein n=1 Tax=Haemaphysalis longicornis TaxID=44386 RepID=A0A9J6GC82_HAELO|nr:hypothetical protein HPB48_019566 [Haemaphysalis longicornis]
MFFPEAVIKLETAFFSGKVSAKCMEHPLYELIIENVEGLPISSSWTQMAFRRQREPNQDSITNEGTETPSKDVCEPGKHKSGMFKVACAEPGRGKSDEEKANDSGAKLFDVIPQQFRAQSCRES